MKESHCMPKRLKRCQEFREKYLWAIEVMKLQLIIFSKNFNKS